MSSATHAGFANDSWQTPRNARTFRAYMALQNQEIAGRIRELRGGRPQTVVADEIGVAERTYQNWEAGDAKPSYRSLQKLAAFYGVGEEFILTGAERTARDDDALGTPDLLGATQLDRIETKLEHASKRDGLFQELVHRQNELLGRQSEILERIEHTLERIEARLDGDDEVRQALDDSAEALAESAREAARRLREASLDDAPPPARARRARAKTGSPRASN